jgi:hypothetical protein
LANQIPNKDVTVKTGFLIKLLIAVSGIVAALLQLIVRQQPQEIISGTKILVCSIGKNSVLKMLSSNDCAVYAAIYKNVRQQHFEDAKEFIGRIRSDGYDVVHFLADFNSDKTVVDTANNVSDFEIMTTARDAHVKLLFSAAETNGPFTNTAVKPLPIQFVFTLNRHGEIFDRFLEKLLRLMSTGYSMPVAWVQAAPPYGTPEEKAKCPDCVFAAGRGQVLFLP